MQPARPPALSPLDAKPGKASPPRLSRGAPVSNPLTCSAVLFGPAQQRGFSFTCWIDRKSSVPVVGFLANPAPGGRAWALWGLFRDSEICPWVTGASSSSFTALGSCQDPSEPRARNMVVVGAHCSPASSHRPSVPAPVPSPGSHRSCQAVQTTPICLSALSLSAGLRHRQTAHGGRSAGQVFNDTSLQAHLETSGTTLQDHRCG